MGLFFFLVGFLAVYLLQVNIVTYSLSLHCSIKLTDVVCTTKVKVDNNVIDFLLTKLMLCNICDYRLCNECILILYS